MELETITFENGEFKDKDGTLINPEKIGSPKVIVIDVPSFSPQLWSEEQHKEHSEKRAKKVKDTYEHEVYQNELQKANAFLVGSPYPLEISSNIPHQNNAQYIAIPLEFYKK